jgi:two-component system sensor histidine kinase ChvG
LDGSQRDGRRRRGFLSLNSSPLARKIVMFNLIALGILVAGILFLNPSRESLVTQRADALVSVSQMVVSALEAQIEGMDKDLVEDAGDMLEQLALRGQHTAYVFGPDGTLVASGRPVGGDLTIVVTNFVQEDFVIIDTIDRFGEWLMRLVGAEQMLQPNGLTADSLANTVGRNALQGRVDVLTTKDQSGASLFAVASPVRKQGAIVGAVALATTDIAMDQMLKREREQVLKMFLVAILVSIGLSLVLASLIANPLTDLADAAEVGRDRNRRGVSHNRIRIPDMTNRPDEIGRLSGALRGMVSALYERIESNEQFAADVAHEIKNPLASLRSAVGTLRVARRDDQRDRLLDVIDHDVRRLDRLVSDISNASRLDSELVKEEEESFDLNKMLQNLSEYLGQEAGSKGIDFISDLPNSEVTLRGLEARLAQVFVNLISNAISFCEQGDAIRLWCRVKESRVLVVVEDTGPGIPEQALTKIFKRFYSERPEGQFGNNSGLGLAISKQIVEAHGGVIWAENIRPTDADITSEPLGARFVVGLPI